VALTQGANITITGTYPNFTIAATGAFSGLWQNVADGTTQNITKAVTTDDVFLFGDVTDSESNGKKLVFDERTGYLHAGDLSNPKSAEGLRGTNCQSLGNGNQAEGTENCVTGKDNSTDSTTIHCFVSGNNHVLVGCEDSSVNGFSCACEGLKEVFVAGRNCDAIGSGIKQRCSMIGSAHTISEACNDTHMIGAGHTSATLNAQNNIMIGTGHTCTSTDAVNNVLMGDSNNDGGFRGQLICNGASGSAVTGNSNFRCRMAFGSGYQYYTDSGLTTGAEMLSGASSWSSVSDINCKEEIVLLNDQAVLDAAVNVPVYSYKYKWCSYDEDGNFLDCEGNILPGDPRATYMGPMAQEWNPIFNNDQNTCSINQQDEIAVLLSCVRALKTEVETLKTRVGLLGG
jgi:hypothetical protein